MSKTYKAYLLNGHGYLCIVPDEGDPINQLCPTRCDVHNDAYCTHKCVFFTEEVTSDFTGHVEKEVFIIRLNCVTPNLLFKHVIDRRGMKHDE